MQVEAGVIFHSTYSCMTFSKAAGMCIDLNILPVHVHQGPKGMIACRPIGPARSTWLRVRCVLLIISGSAIVCGFLVEVSHNVSTLKE